MAVPPLEPPRKPDRFPPGAADMELFARIEDLVGEEHALLTIPARERTGGQRDRLGAIGRELDRIFDTLKERAERLAARPAGEDAGA